MQTNSEQPVPPAEANDSQTASDEAVVCKELLGEPSLTLTAQEIRHLAQFCGIVVQEPTADEAEDERETEIIVAPWPTKGVQGDDGMLAPRKHIAYLAEYPDEGCVPLGSPNAPDEPQARSKTST